MATMIAAVGYIRMSTDKQETSPEQQRIEVKRYAAKHGYSILRWYEDLGISGDKTEKRLGFQQMITDADDGRFKAILCWDQDRFGRFDSLESGFWIHPLRKRNVQLVTCTDGPVDWNSFAGRMLYGMKQEGKHQFLVDLSNNVNRKMRQIASDGTWVAGKPSIGYVIDANRKLILGPEQDVQLVRDVFNGYAAGKSTRELSKMLSDRGSISPMGKPWSAQGIASLIRNPVYLGTFRYGKNNYSKYQRKPGDGRLHPQDEWTVIQNNHEPIIDQETFDTCQQMLKDKRKHTTPIQGGGDFALTGMLRCAHCGASMHGDRCNEAHSYTCYTYHQRPGECERHNVRQQEALLRVLAELKAKLFAAGILKRLKAELYRQLTVPTSRPEPQKQIEAIESKIEAAEHRLMEVSKDMIPRIEKQIRTLEQQRDDVLAAASVNIQQTTVARVDVDKQVELALRWFRNMERLAVGKYEPQKLRTMLQQFIDKVELRFERTQWGKSAKRFKCNLVGGTIHFKLMGLANISPQMCASPTTEDKPYFTLQIPFGLHQPAA